MLCRICDAVSKYYLKRFIPKWKIELPKECAKIKVVAALVVENRSEFEMKVGVLATGTKYSTKTCFIDDDSSRIMCDGHAEAVCYHLANVYLMTEIYKLKDKEDSIFQNTLEGYALRSNIYFHLFISHPPCGFMAEEKDHFLSWKQSDEGKPHILECSSQILIGAYLGIQGPPLNDLLNSPIYISSIIIPKYKAFSTLDEVYIKDQLQKFKIWLASHNEDLVHIPEFVVVDVNVSQLFSVYYKPVVNQHEELKKQTKGGTDKISFTVPDIIEEDSIIMVIFSLENGIKHEIFEKLLCQLIDGIRMDLPSNIKQRRSKSSQQACDILSSAIKESLEKLEKEIATKLTEKYQKKNEISSKLLEIFKCNSSIMKGIQTTEWNIEELEDKLARLKCEKENDIKTLDQCYSSLMNNLKEMVQLCKKSNHMKSHKGSLGCNSFSVHFTKKIYKT